MARHHTALTGLVAAALVYLAAPAGAVRIGLFGSSYMDPVAAALDRVGLEHERLEAGQLLTLDSGSLDVLFLSHNALEPTDDEGEGMGPVAADSALAWLAAYRAAGGTLFTFYGLPAGLQPVLGIGLGPYTRQQYEGQFASIRSNGALPRLPANVPQRSRNINLAKPMADSVQVVATWFDARGEDTALPALLLGPGGAHLTHVLLGDDTEAAAHLYTALISHFHPEVWGLAVEGALISADRVGGGRTALAELVAGSKRAEESLGLAESAVGEAEVAWRDGQYGPALAAAFRSRRQAVQAYARAQETREREFRAVWIHNPFGVADWGWDRSCEVLAEAGINAIIPNMFDAGLTSYPSDVLPVDARVAERGDQMAALVRAARRHGIEVHAWKVNYSLMGAPPEFVEQLRREDRLQANTSGDEVPWLCPSHPHNLALEVESMLEVVRNYDVAGIHFDYIRYPGMEGCYDDGCRVRFQAETGHVVQEWPQDVLTGELVEPFQKWRQDQITDLVRAVAVEARLIRPGLRISAAVFSNWPESRFAVGQDWIRWVEEGYLDFVCPMDYIPDTGQFMDRVRHQVSWVDGRVPLYIGIGAWQMANPEEVLRQIAFTRQAGADGFVLFEYSSRLAAEVLPLMREGLTSEAAHVSHRGPHVHFAVEGKEHGEVLAGARYYRAGDPVDLVAQVVASPLTPRARGRVSWQTLAGETVLDLGEVRTDGVRSLRHATGLEGGDYRPTVTGTYRDSRGKKRPFTRRGPVVQVRQAAFLDSLDDLYGPPEIPGDGVPTAVYADGYGASSILAALSEDASLAVYHLRHFSPAALDATEVLVIPQPYNRWTVNRLTRDRLRAWVREGGALLVTHDMAGMRGALPVVPEVCRRGTGYPRSVQWRTVADHPAVAGVPGGLQPHSYYDHVTLEPGPDGRVLAEDDEGRPVLVVGSFGEGKYAALGLVPGLGPDDQDVPVEGTERQLVEALVRWLAE